MLSAASSFAIGFFVAAAVVLLLVFLWLLLLMILQLQMCVFDSRDDGKLYVRLRARNYNDSGV